LRTELKFLLCLFCVSLLSACASHDVVSINYQPSDPPDPIVTRSKNPVVLYLPPVENRNPNSDFDLTAGFNIAGDTMTTDIPPSELFHQALKAELQRLGIKIIDEKNQAQGYLRGVLRNFNVGPLGGNRNSMMSMSRAEIDLELFRTGEMLPVWVDKLESQIQGSLNLFPYSSSGIESMRGTLSQALHKAISNLKNSHGFVAALRKLSDPTSELASKPGQPQVATDVTPPSIIITSHKTERGIKIVENLSKAQIIGQASDPSGVAEVKVNGQTTSLDEDGNFKADVFLKVGDNKVIISAMDVRENIGRKIFTIKRNPKVDMVKRSEVVGQESFGRFYALIVGNNNYQHLPSLNMAINDAREIEKILSEKYGFETQVLLDATRSDILNSLNEMRDRLGPTDSFLFYYAGHGEFDKSSDKAYWLPVDAELDNDANWILADRITSNIKRFLSNHILIIADSCYSGTMTRSLDTSVNAKGPRNIYIKKMLNKPSRSLISSGGNEPVADTGGKGHSIFAQILLKSLSSIENKIFTAEELFYSHIKEAVAGRADQTPEYSIIRNSGHEGGDFLFVKD
jgi:hypothetical protein